MRVDFSKGPVDVLPSELIIAPFFADDRPLKGAAGLFDWRMEGFFAGLLRRGRLSGELGESLLLPPRKVAASRILLFGLGEKALFVEERRRLALETILRKALDLGPENFHLCAQRLVLEGDDGAEAMRRLGTLIREIGASLPQRSGREATATLLVDEKAFGEFVEVSSPSLD